jgi:hypothetical protein
LDELKGDDAFATTGLDLLPSGRSAFAREESSADTVAAVLMGIVGSARAGDRVGDP